MSETKWRTPRTRVRLVCGLALTWPGMVMASDTWTVSGKLSAGSVYRLEDRESTLLQSSNAAYIGLHGTAGSGQNADDANLNFGRHDIVSGAWHAYLDIDGKLERAHVFLRFKAWDDWVLRHAARPWGNQPNAYQAGAPLSDVGFTPLARFSGLEADEAWAEFGVGAGRLKVGQQVLGWGLKPGFPGGLSALDAMDLAALHRAGAAPQELRVPAPMLRLQWPLAQGMMADGFLQTRARASAIDGCGTFFAINDFSAEGCNRVVAGQPVVADRLRVQAGAYLKRTASPYPPSKPEFGFGLRQSDPDGLAWGLYAAQTASRVPHPGLTKSTRTAGAPFIVGDPDGRNVSYFVEYPDAIRVFGATLEGKQGPWSWSTELAYRPNQPVQQTATDLLGAFLSATTPALLREEVNAMAPGARYHGYDRKRTLHWQTGLQWDGRWDGAPVSASLQAVDKYVWDRPDPALRRYGRADQFNPGPIRGQCPVTTARPDLQCSLNGYVSANAWGLRAKLEGQWSGWLPGVQLAPSLVWQHDMHGWSYDYQLNEGRNQVQLGLRASWRQRYTAELLLAPNGGGGYNALSDRDWLAWSLGVTF